MNRIDSWHTDPSGSYVACCFIIDVDGRSQRKSREVGAGVPLAAPAALTSPSLYRARRQRTRKSSRHQVGEDETCPCTPSPGRPQLQITVTDRLERQFMLVMSARHRDSFRARLLGNANWFKVTVCRRIKLYVAIQDVALVAVHLLVRQRIVSRVWAVGIDPFSCKDTVVDMVSVTAAEQLESWN